MEKVETLTPIKACQLLKIHEQINKVGSGIVHYNQDSIKISGTNDYIATLSCSLQQLQSNLVLTQIDQSIYISLLIKQQSIQSLPIFLQFYHNRIEPLLKQSNTIAKRLKSVMIQVPTQQNYQQLVLILKYLQSKLISIILQPVIEPNSWPQYQEQLCQFSLKILEQQHLFISAISVILKLPYFSEKDSLDYLTILLAVWKRCLPAGLGAIIIKDWLNSEIKLQKPILGLHLIKKLKPCWKLQFITQNIQNCESLGCQCLGID